MMIAMAIRFPTDVLDLVAKKYSIETPLTYTKSNIAVKYTYDGFDDRLYNSLSATEKQECILLYLREQIDFEHYMQSGQIHKHFPLHKR